MQLQKFAAFSAILASSVFAQTAATLTGTVRDPTGGLVSGVEVAVTQIATGSVRRAVTNRGGVYLIPALRAGNIEIRATAPGFRPLLR